MLVGACNMNEEQAKWRQQYTSNIGMKEFLRLGCAISSWILTLILLAIVFGFAGISSKLTGLFLAIVMIAPLFVFPFIAHSWKPGYLLIRRILANENLPKEPYPKSRASMASEPRPRWIYMLGIWHWLLILIIVFIILKWYFQ